MFNKFKTSTCELPNNKCFYHHLHKCLACQKWGCKTCNHKPPGQTDFNKPQAEHQCQAHVASNIATNSGPSPSCDHGPGFPPSDQVPPTQDLTNVLSSMQNSLQSLSVRMEKLERPPAPIPLVAPPAAPNPGSAPGPDFSLQVPAYGCPAVTAIPNLPLPIDSCCSLSLVSKAHADVIAKKHPHLTFTKLQSSLPVAVANPSSQLKAIGLMEVPIIWENGRPSIFSMLVVPGLAWPILFGQNHLSKTKAHTDHSGLTVHFADPPMNFTVTCRDTNPLDAFSLLRNQTSSSAPLGPSSSLSQGSSTANVTCLLIAMPSPSNPAPTFAFIVGSI